VSRARERQLAYSELQPQMLDEEGRRTKARKILRVLEHFLGRPDLTGLLVLDVGSSTGFIADELARSGGRTFGVDIDVPGLAAARRRFGAGVGFLCADGERLPFPDGSVDVVVLNMIYEHVVDPDAVVSELRRVVKPDGLLYLGLGNRLGVDAYVRASGRADHYHERFRTRRGLRRLVTGLTVWDYTYTVIADPVGFAAEDVVPRAVARLPLPLVRLASPLLPTYIWVASKSSRGPRGRPTTVPPRPVRA